MPISDRLKLRLVLLRDAGVHLVLAAFGLALFCLLVPSIVVVVVTVGIPLLAVELPALRGLAELHRRWVERFYGIELPSPYLPAPPTGNPIVRLAYQSRDPARWRDLAWLAYNSTLGLAVWILAFVYGLFAVIFWWLPPLPLQHLNAAVARALLSPNRGWYLSERVNALSRSRAGALDESASEIRRIERDLHDGAQAKLVSLGINLGLAEELLALDPDQARRLLTEARQTSGAALTELRELVRGIHPPVLADRGLVGAVQALALAAPLPVTVRASIDRRLPAPVESAAYFAVAELLTNVAKHAQAGQAAVAMELAGGRLRIQVSDDGVGGAGLSPDGGLRGVERRLSAFDGTLRVHSPAGGPTDVVMELPCALSLPKTARSSPTG